MRTDARIEIHQPHPFLYFFLATALEKFFRLRLNMKNENGWDDREVEESSGEW